MGTHHSKHFFDNPWISAISPFAWDLKRTRLGQNGPRASRLASAKDLIESGTQQFCHSDAYHEHLGNSWQLRMSSLCRIRLSPHPTLARQAKGIDMWFSLNVTLRMSEAKMERLNDLCTSHNSVSIFGPLSESKEKKEHSQIQPERARHLHCLLIPAHHCVQEHPRTIGGAAS